LEKDGEDNKKVGKVSQFVSQTPSQGQNMIKFQHDGFRYHVEKHVGKGMMM